MTNKDLIKQVRDLLPKITDGEWRVKELSGKYYGTEVVIGSMIVTVWGADNYTPSEREIAGGWQEDDGMDHVENAEDYATAQFIALAPKMAEALLEQENKIAELKSRLEMDWIYNHRGEKEPWQEGMPDAIDCRNQTIKILEHNNKRLLAKLEIAREALSFYADYDVNTDTDGVYEFHESGDPANMMTRDEGGAAQQALREMEAVATVGGGSNCQDGGAPDPEKPTLKQDMEGGDGK